MGPRDGRVVPEARWETRLLGSAHEARWVERRNVALAEMTDTSEYSDRFAVAINWDGPVESADAGLTRTEDSIVAALTRENLCLYALAYLCDIERDLVFYTRSPIEAQAIVDDVQGGLPDVTLIPEVARDQDWSDYRTRLEASGALGSGRRTRG